MTLTRLLRVGETIRNHSTMWYGERRRVTAVNKSMQGNYYYRFIALGGPDDGAASTTTHATAQRLFADRSWKWDYPPRVQLPEGI